MHILKKGLDWTVPMANQPVGVLLRTVGIYYTAAVAVMWGLKYHYSIASADQLDWILAPTAWLVQWLDGLPYVKEMDIGYVRCDQRIIIAPACAGLNFMIMAFGLAVVMGLHPWRRSPERMVWLSGALIAAYVLTIGVNSVRIMLSIFFFEAHIAWEWLTPPRLHRLIGVLIYFGFLWLYYGGLRLIIERNPWLSGMSTRLYGSVRASWLPLGWYWLGTLGVPAVHQLHLRQSLPSAEHCLTVILVSVLVWGGGRKAWQISKRVLSGRTSLPVPGTKETACD